MESTRKYAFSNYSLSAASLTSESSPQHADLTQHSLPLSQQRAASAQRSFSEQQTALSPEHSLPVTGQSSWLLHFAAATHEAACLPEHSVLAEHADCPFEHSFRVSEQSFVAAEHSALTAEHSFPVAPTSGQPPEARPAGSLSVLNAASDRLAASPALPFEQHPPEA